MKSATSDRERAESFTTISGRPIERLYTREDIKSLDYRHDLADPGTFPYTRGIHASGYRGKVWTMRQFAGFGTPEETNERYKQLLAAGGTGLSVAFDLPTLMGRDPDDPLSLGEVGKCGVSVVTLADMERLFDGIALGDITTSMTINSPAPMIFAMYLAVAEKQGASWKHAVGHASERHPQGIHRAEGIHLSAASFDAAHHGHLRVLREGSAEVEHDLRERVPHP
jgi:methylmalonyl-CoA mutase N-terminal domain/subunit